jgi:hypothetical protein
VLDDFRTAPIDERLRPMLAFLQKMALAPSELTADDTRALGAAGVTQAQARDAIYVGYIFAVFVRMADSLSFGLHSDEEYVLQARGLLKRGYR